MKKKTDGYYLGTTPHSISCEVETPRGTRIGIRGILNEFIRHLQNQYGEKDLGLRIISRGNNDRIGICINRTGKHSHKIISDNDFTDKFCKFAMPKIDEIKKKAKNKKDCHE